MPKLPGADPKTDYPEDLGSLEPDTGPPAPKKNVEPAPTKGCSRTGDSLRHLGAGRPYIRNI